MDVSIGYGLSTPSKHAPIGSELKSFNENINDHNVFNRIFLTL